MFRPSDEPTILEVSLRNADAVCKVCGEMIAGAEVICLRCQTPHHRDCWRYFGRCSTYGCGERRFATWGTLEKVQQRRKVRATTTIRRFGFFTGGLAAIVLAYGVKSTFMDAQQKARFAYASSDLLDLTFALERYQQDHGTYPSTQQGLRALVPYINYHKVPQNPWRRDYYYVRHEEGAGYTIWSSGPRDEFMGAELWGGIFRIKSGQHEHQRSH